MNSAYSGSTTRSPIRSLRWWIAATLFASTIINYLDRQTLSWLAPYLKIQYHWSNTDYAYIVIAFRVAYTIGQTVFGRLMDRLGTRRGLTFTVLWYSVVSILTPLANGLYSFGLFRFLLGAGESANWPAATKAVSEWFPKQERGLATAFFDSGSSVGGAIAPYIVLSIYFRWGWRPAVIVPGVLGFFWILLWRKIYRPPETHPRISEAERQLLAQDKHDVEHIAGRTLAWSDLLSLPQTWGTIIARAFTDPVWFFVADWFPIYLVAKGINLRSGILAVWVPFIAADLGNFFGGTASGWLVKRGWTLGWARKAVVIFGGIGVMLLIPTIWTTKLNLIVALFALATFSYASFSTIANVLPSDLYESGSVASVSGIGGSAAGVGTIIAFFLIGRISDLRQGTATHAFDPIVIAAGLIPFIGMILVLLLVRNTEATKQRLVREI
ncbi:MAG TPA: MFS transporter [Terriglobales bacterium]|nr:MFS transporter [Terriglobales bacterium]